MIITINTAPLDAIQFKSLDPVNTVKATRIRRKYGEIAEYDRGDFSVRDDTDDSSKF